jgi:RimJ/RimL family protein N-acetyltransferase
MVAMGDAVGPVVTPGTLARTRQPELHAEELVLRPWTDEDHDVEAVARALADPDIQRWFPDVRGGLSEARQWLMIRRRRWQTETGADWAIELEGATVGRMGLVRLDLASGIGEVGYWLLPEGRGRGLAARALLVLADWAFGTVALHRLELVHSVRNPASCRVARRAGFALEGTARRRMLHRDGWHDMHVHARLADDPPPAADRDRLD